MYKGYRCAGTRCSNNLEASVLIQFSSYGARGQRIQKSSGSFPFCLECLGKMVKGLPSEAMSRAANVALTEVATHVLRNKKKG